MNRPRVIIIQEVLFRYRVPIFKILEKDIDLTLAYTTKNEITDPDFNIIHLPNRRIGRLIIHKGIYRILNQFDVVISQPHLTSVRLCLLQYFPRKFKLITWTIGKHVSYNTPFDLTIRPSILDWVFETIQDGADACIFYMKETIQYWEKYKKIDSKKYFVAHNTVAISVFDELPLYDERDSFLFVGTLYAQKGIDELIKAYSIAKSKRGDMPPLRIIGDGPEKERLLSQIRIEGLESDVYLCGGIYDEELLKQFFLKAMLCISPKQAGLSVLKSFGYGCPFVTSPYAITGGERENIINGTNGLLYSSEQELVDLLVAAANKEKVFAQMSVNARDYYINNCSPEVMANGIISALNYVLSE